MHPYFVDTSDPTTRITATQLQQEFRHVLGIASLSDAALAQYGRARLTVHAAPAFDPAVEVLEDPVIEQDPDDTWHMRTPVRDKTQAELDADAATAAALMTVAIREHAEALIKDGIILEASQFRGDGDSRARLAESIDGLTRGVISTAKFTTAAGVAFEVSDPAVLAALRDVFIAYGAAVLAASTDLQQSPPASIEDVPGNAAWPAVPNLTIADITPPA